MSNEYARLAVVAAVLVAAAASAAGARADGLPVLGVSTAQGVVPPGRGSRYLALAAGQGTLVLRVQRAGGRLFRSRYLPGTFTVPAVAYDGTPDGLSHDGRTLVLIRPRTQWPRQQTAFAILDARSLHVDRVMTLRGDFSFDAISPRGRSLYLIQYVSPRDPSRYRVRVYDTVSGRLLPKSIVDPTGPGEAMRGSPITRATSPDGRWAYTLYDGGGSHPFVHALSVSRRTARCIDLDELAGLKALWRLRLRVSPDGRELSVVDGRRAAVVNVDTRTFAVTRPAAGGNEGSDGSRVALWILAAAGGAVLAAAALAIFVRRGRVSLPKPT